MDLKEYLDKMGIRKTSFAARVGVSPTSIENAIKHKDITLSLALRIERETFGKVKCKDLAPTVTRSELLKKEKSKKSDKDHDSNQNGAANN